MTDVRLATAADTPALARLRYEFRSAINEPSEPEAAFLARCEAWMAARLAVGSAWRCWVFEQDGATAGCLWLQLIEKIPNPVPELETHAYITNVFVRRDARGRGVAGGLLDAALVFCREARVDSVILWPTARSRPLYERHGFAVRDDLMELQLDPGRQ